MPPSALEAEAIDVRGALRLAEKEGEFDTGLVWKTMTRIGQARTYSTNANLLRIFPDHCDRPASELAAIGKIAVCVHMYYVDMLDEILDLASNIPLPFDFLATTDTEKKKKEIESALGRPSAHRQDRRARHGRKSRTRHVRPVHLLPRYLPD